MRIGLFETSKTFILRREEQSHRDGVHLTVFRIYDVIDKPKLNFQKIQRASVFFKLQKPQLSGWVGGWVCDLKGPSILLKIGFSNKQDVLILNRGSKVVYDY